MNQKWIIPLFLLGITVLPVSVAALIKWSEDRFGIPAVLVPDNGEIKFALHNQSGLPVSEADWEGKIIIAHGFFSHCPLVCPKIIRLLRPLSTMPGVGIASFSVDPERDSVERLRDYAQQLKLPREWMLLTGEKIQMYRFLRKGLALVATDGDGGPMDFIHSELLVLLDGRRNIRGYYKGTDEKEVDRLKTDIVKLTNL